MRPYGAEQELLLALRTQGGEPWGMLGLFRAPGERPFDADVADGARRVAVIVEPAHLARISSLLMATYRLTEREQDVTRLVCEGTPLRTSPIVYASAPILKRV